MYFASDNTAGMAPEILDALGKANTGYALGYGNDDWTKRVEARFAEIFEREGRGVSGARPARSPMRWHSRM
jgi:threonine aldolase